MVMKKTNWQLNRNVFIVNSIFNWFQVSIGVWVLIWTKYLDFKQIALIYSLSLMWSTVLELPTGALADLLGRKNTVIIGRVLNIAGNLVYSIANSFPLFLIANVLYQSNWAFESGAQSALLYDSLKENNKDKEYYKKTEADTYLYCTLGMVGASILGGFLYRFNIHSPYYVCVIVSIISLVVTFFFQEPSIDSEKFTFQSYIKQHVEGVKHIFENDMIRKVSFFSFAISFITYAALWYLYEPRLTAGGFPAYMMGILVAGTYLIRAFGTKLIFIIDAKIKKFQIPLVLTLLQTIGSFLSFIPGPTGAILSVYERKFVDGIRLPIVAQLQNEQIASKYRATALSAISLFTNLLLGLAGPLIGFGMFTYGPAITLGLFGFVGLFACFPLAFSLSNKMKGYRTIFVKNEN